MKDRPKRTHVRIGHQLTAPAIVAEELYEDLEVKRRIDDLILKIREIWTLPTPT